VHERLPGGRHAGALEPLAELGARERPVGRERPLDRLDAALGRALADALLAQPARAAGELARRREGMEPGVVLGADEMEGAAVQPVDDERAVVVERAVDVGRRQAARAGANRQPEAARVLRLDCQQPLSDRDRVARRLAGEQLGGEPRPVRPSGATRRSAPRCGRAPWRPRPRGPSAARS
jgi:hypothetical protein